MALATQCPHCQTTFRVAHDQLKLRAGLVRCGACKQIFNGIENLLRLEDGAQQAPAPASSSGPPVAAPAATAVQPAPATPAPAVQADTSIAALLNNTAAAANETAEQTRGPQAPQTMSPPAAEMQQESRAENPMLRMTLLDFAHVPRKPSAAEGTDPQDESEQKEEADPLQQAMDDLERKPWRSSAASGQEADPLDNADAAGYDEPAFVRQARRQQRLGEALRSAMGAGSLILLLILVLQSVFAMRDQVAARFPATRPALSAVCDLFGCQVGLPAQIDTVSIESSELQRLSTDSNIFALTILLRNQGSTVEAWPHIELTLNDSNEQALVRRVFVPGDYLPAGTDVGKGFAERSEQAVKLYFELAQVQASGYRVYVFYP